MFSVPIAAGLKRHDDVVCKADDGAEIWIRVTEFDDETVTGTKGIPKAPGEPIKKEQLESLTFPRASILRYGRK